MTNQYFFTRIGGRDPDLRASDADRERISERLRTSHAEGRLDMAEFQQRLERCYEAKKLGELSELVVDLPQEDQGDVRRSLGPSRLWRWRPAPLAPLLIVLVLVATAIGHHLFWLWIPLVFLFWRMSWLRRRRWLAGARRGMDEWV